MSNWIDDLKLGDKVIVWNDSVATVDRMTTLHVVVGGRKYRRRGGMLVGEWWSGFLRPRIDKYDGAAAERIERRDLFDSVYSRSNYDQFVKLSTEQLRAIKAMFDGVEA